jgi:hypothetical protein
MLKDIPFSESQQAKTDACILEDPRLVIREVGRYSNLLADPEPQLVAEVIAAFN